MGLHKGKCNAPGHNETIISHYHSSSGFKIYDHEYWWSKKWDAVDYGRDYDWTKPFFANFKELLHDVPLYDLRVVDSVNCFYAMAFHSKNCYVGSVYNCEDCLYADSAFSRNSVDISHAYSLENCYECSESNKNFGTLFSVHTDNSVDSLFLFNCNNLQNCAFCVNLRNKQYYFFNQPLSKEQYEAKINGLDLGDFQKLEEAKRQFSEFVLKYPRKYCRNINAQNAIGDGLKDARNCQQCFYFTGGVEDCKFISGGGVGLKDSYDVSYSGVHSELFYETVGSGENASNVRFSVNIMDGAHSVQYSVECHNSTNLFGCVGLRNKQYCILNKQYTKEKYEELVPKIIAHMNEMPYTDRKGRTYTYGEFFPPEFSPFAYNESAAQEETYPKFIREEAVRQGYWWRDPEPYDYAITKLAADLPVHIKDVDDSILKKVVGCAHEEKCSHECASAFIIIPRELSFYRKMNLPLPRICPNCRYAERKKHRNRFKLWHRACQCAGAKSENGVYTNTVVHFHKDGHCPNEFETSYSPERKEIVYCEACYNAEVV
ncbi:MAG: hypothetical protein V1885_02275 [Candidatus Brennerbacteria bacterium]